MVFLNSLIALFFLCLCFSLLIIISTKKNVNILFGFLMMVLSGIFLLSFSELSAENVIFVILGLLVISIMFAFQFRDKLIVSIESEDSGSDSNG